MAGIIWQCKIGEFAYRPDPEVMQYMHNELQETLGELIEEIMGEKPSFVITGWDGELTELERAIIQAGADEKITGDMYAQEPEDPFKDSSAPQKKPSSFWDTLDRGD